MKLMKLRNVSLQELRVRATQRLSAFSERHGWSELTKLPSDLAFASLFVPPKGEATYDPPKFFRLRSKPAFFASFQNPETTINEFKARWPATAQRLSEKADRVCEGQFDLLGFTNLTFGDPIDWHFEPISRKRIPLLHWSKLDYLNVEIAGDKKITWELNRHQHFITLGQAYWLTGDERYARVFADHLESWMDANPPKLGINWASSLEIAFRSIAWLWGFYFFKHSESITNQTFNRAWKFLYLGARHLESYLSTYFSPNTHLTGEALGLFYLGTLLPEFKNAKRWQNLGSKILIDQLPVHVRPDGVYFEQSTYYHRYTTDFYLHFLLLARANNFTLPKQVGEYLVLLLNHLMYITRPDGTTPLIGDDDGGRLVMLDVRPANDFRPTLAIGSVLFDRADYKFVAGDSAEDLLWLLGVEGVRHFDSIVALQPRQMSKAFHDGGYYVMRDGWTDNSNYLLFDCGPHGSLACGHAHADALSFDLAANGRTLLVDPGTYTYTGSKELRDWFRSSQAHNTISLDGESSSVPDTAFRWEAHASCVLDRWVSNDRFDFISARHDGFARFQDPAIVERNILFLKGNYWVVRDTVSSSSGHCGEVRFHFDSNVSSDVPSLEIKCFGDGSWNEEIGWVSQCYGQKEPARTGVFVANFKMGHDVVSFLLPRKTELDVVELKEHGGRAFAVQGAKTLDIVIIQSGQQLEWIVLRFEDEELQEVFSPQNDTGEEIDLSDPYLSALISGRKNYVRH